MIASHINGDANWIWTSRMNKGGSIFLYVYKANGIDGSVLTSGPYSVVVTSHEEYIHELMMNTIFNDAFEYLADVRLYSFTAPEKDTYVFETIGHRDTYCSIWQSVEYWEQWGTTNDCIGQITWDNNSGENNNFRIKLILERGESILLCVYSVADDLTAAVGPYSICVYKEGTSIPTELEQKPISFTMNKTSVNPGFGDRVQFTVTSQSAQKVRLVVDNKYYYDEHSVSNCKATFSESFHVSGARQCKVQGYANGGWSLLSDAQTLTVNTASKLGTPAFTSISNNAGIAKVNVNYNLKWASLTNAVKYSVYVYKGSNEVYKTTVSGTSVTVPASVFSTIGTYYIDVYGMANYLQQSNPGARATITVSENGAIDQDDNNPRISVSPSTIMPGLNNKVTIKMTNAGNAEIVSFFAENDKNGRYIGDVEVTNGVAELTTVFYESGTYKITAEMYVNDEWIECKASTTLLVSTASRLSKPTLTSHSSTTINATAGQRLKLQWSGKNAVEYLLWIDREMDDEYYVYENTTNNSFTFPDYALELGDVYNVYVYALGNNVQESEALKVTVKVTKSVQPTKVELNYSGTVQLLKSNTLYLSTKLTPSNASTTYTWSSSKPSVATVSSYGLVTPVSTGTTTITVKTGNGKKASVKVKVVNKIAPTGIKLNFSGTKYLKVGDKIKVIATLVPSNAQTTMRITTSNKYVVKIVDSNGVLEALKKGTSTITLKTANGKTASFKIKVE